ncbi:hypothetical protein [Aeromonas veronii]|uniref:hypothetical protein n=1 Tax=Aeromonas veronii TaxID=654 RepID=UPI003D1C786D
MSNPILSDNDFIISNVSITHETVNFFTESVNYIGNAKSRGLHRLGVEFTVTLVDANDIKKFEALMLRIRGRLNPFKLSLQDQTDGKGTCNPLFTDVSPMLSNAVSIGNNKLVLSGFSGVIPAGSKFQFPNDEKVFTVLNDTKPNQECEIFPAVRVAHEVKAKLNFSPVPLLRLSGDEFTVSYDKAREITLKAMEAL